MSRYAAETDVPADRSRAEIEKTLQRYGADGFMYGWEGTRAMIGFRLQGRHIKVVMPMPDRQAREFTHATFGARGTQPRSSDAAAKAYDQAVRQRWRALALVIKAKLEATETGITTVEQEFMAHIVLPDGQTVGDYMQPQIAIAYERGDMPKLLPDYTGGK